MLLDVTHLSIAGGFDVEELNMDYFRNPMSPVGQCLQDSGVDKRNVHEVVFVGG